MEHDQSWTGPEDVKTENISVGGEGEDVGRREDCEAVGSQHCRCR